MPFKRWILQRMNRMNAVGGRPDLAPRTSRGHAASNDAGRERREPLLRAEADSVDLLNANPDYLGAYAPLIGAIRDELDHFVSSHLRLHLAIAERDRYLLTSIGIECIDGGDGVDLLRRFSREFTPEQIKRFLARDVIAHLPNASAIDLAQFGGLNAMAAPGNAAADDDAYSELLAQLRATTRSEGPRSFDVTLFGRWTEKDAPAAPGKSDSATAMQTPLAGQRLEIQIEDADGHRHLALSSVVANRRYVIGKGEGCDIAVNGRFVSRRHCEIWLENGAWWACDAGSTNGLRIESRQGGVLGRAGAQSDGSGAKPAIEIVPGARIVLSARMEGEPAEYPRVLLGHGDAKPTPATPLSPGAKSHTTPVTPIAPPRPRASEVTLTATMASGVRTLTLVDKSLPIRIGRSRNQDVVVDWAHEGVSGHHIDIISLAPDAADIEVHGDNGVTVNGETRPPGQRFRWRAGERMTLGRASGDEPECTLLLSART
jgi:pSer/pThr/pTyr-binding forkhead associated (FHA) protein